MKDNTIKTARPATRRNTARSAEMVPEFSSYDSGNDIVDQVLEKLRKQLAGQNQPSKPINSLVSQT